MLQWRTRLTLLLAGAVGIAAILGNFGGFGWLNYGW